MWRNKNFCPYGNDPINKENKKFRGSTTSWDGWHTFYILHENDYSTWYLHSNDLEESVKKDILEKGYSEVFEGQKIAYVGHWGLKGGDHLHFEVRKEDITKVVDPYGWFSEPVLWKDDVPARREPVVILGLKIIDSMPPYYKNEVVTAEFTILNKTDNDIKFEVLTVGGRDPNDRVQDFTWINNITISAGEPYTYRGQIILTEIGNYHFFIAYKIENQDWNPSVPTENNEPNILNINVIFLPPGGGEI